MLLINHLPAQVYISLAISHGFNSSVDAVSIDLVRNKSTSAHAIACHRNCHCHCHFSMEKTKVDEYFHHFSFIKKLYRWVAKNFFFES
jgi:hypothetical protein